jgi:periplasmic glucans biosynthesis protein
MGASHRPEMHDNDGLLMQPGSGNFHFRPLETTKDQCRHCVLAMEMPSTWALLQRHRLFSCHQDPESLYQNRPA